MIVTKPNSRHHAGARNQSEDALQRAVASYLDLVIRPPAWWWHTPNGGRRSRAEAGIFKAHGVKAGVPDVLIVAPSRAWARWPLADDEEPVFLCELHSIELKTATGRLRLAQEEWRDRCLEAGMPWALCRSLEDVQATLREWSLVR